MEFQHVSVLLEETIEGLNIRPKKLTGNYRRSQDLRRGSSCRLR